MRLNVRKKVSTQQTHNVGSTSWRWINIESTLFQRCVPAEYRHVRPAIIQNGLRIYTVSSESSLGTFWIAKDANFLHAVNEDWSGCAHHENTLI